MHLEQMQLRPYIVSQACAETENVLTHSKHMQLEPCIVLPSSCWDRKLVNTLETKATQAVHGFPQAFAGTENVSTQLARDCNVQ